MNIYCRVLLVSSLEKLGKTRKASYIDTKNLDAVNADFHSAASLAREMNRQIQIIGIVVPRETIGRLLFAGNETRAFVDPINLVASQARIIRKGRAYRGS